jgi:virulence-associated protein VagC
MTVVYMAGLVRGRLSRNRIWVERAFPERRWVIADVQVCEDGSRRVVIEPVEDRTREASYSESYFRRHFMDVATWLRRENERVLRKAKRRDSAEVLTHMAQMNGS